MVKITIVYFGGITLFHCASHVAAILEDLQTNQRFLIDYPFDSYDNDDVRAASPNETLNLYSRVQNNCFTNSVILYSNKKYDAIIEKFKSNANFEEDAYQFVTNNCATAVNYVLDYFFGEERTLNLFYQMYQTLCCVCCIGTVGLQIFPVPPCIDSPTDTLRRAKLLAKMGYDQMPEEYLQRYKQSSLFFSNTTNTTTTASASEKNPIQTLNEKINFIPLQ